MSDETMAEMILGALGVGGIREGGEGKASVPFPVAFRPMPPRGGMNRKWSDAVPHGECEYDCDFQVGRVTTVDGKAIYGVIWYAGGEAWNWSEYGTALCHARCMAERHAIARMSGRSRSGVKVR